MKIAEILSPLRKALNGNAVEVFERAISQLETKRDGAIAWLSNFERRRDELLLSGDTESLAKLRAERQTVEDERDAAEVALAQIRAKLGLARDEARQKRWTKIRSEFDPLVAELVAKLAAARVAFDAFIAARAAAEREGFGREVSHLPAFPQVEGAPMTAKDLVDGFMAKWRQIDGRQVKPAGRVAQLPVRGKVPGRFPQEDKLPATVDRQQVQPIAVRHETAPALPDDLAPLAADEVRARVVRSGYPDKDGHASHRGRIIRVEKKIAARAAANGGIEILPDDTAEMQPPVQSNDTSADTSAQISARS